MKHIDVIIVNFNSTQSAIESIQSLERETEGIVFHIFVVDNASMDGAHMLARYPSVSCIFNTENVGYSKAINQALKIGESPFVVIMNPDTIALNGFISDVIAFMEKNEDVGIVGPKILDADGTVQGSARRFPTIWTSIFGRRSPLTKLFPNNPITKKEFPCFDNNGKDSCDVDWVSGACMVIRRPILEAVNGFDERFFLYWEDTDICRRIKEDGYRTVYFKKAMIRHMVGQSSNTRPIRSICHFHLSCFKLFQKYAKGINSLLAPFVLIGLFTRCLFVISLKVSFQLIRRSSEVSSLNAIKNDGKIKVLLLVPQISGAIHSTHVVLLKKYLDDSRFISKLVTGSLPQSRFNDEGIVKGSTPISELRCGATILMDWIALIKLVKIVIKEKPDIVHTYMTKAGIIGRIAVLSHNFFSRKKIKVVHSYHNYSIGDFPKHKASLVRIIEKIFNRFADALVAVSQTQLWELTGKYNMAAPEKVFLVRSGIDFKMFSENRKLKGQLRNKLGVDSNTILVGSIGRFSPNKNQKMLLDAARQILALNGNIEIKFVFVGDGELRHELELYSISLGLDPYVIFHGWEKDIPLVYADLDILAITSSREDIPLPIIEAMASSVPVITTGVGGVKELLGRIYDTEINPNGFKVCERGLLCPKNDVQSFVHGLNYLLSNAKPKELIELDKARNFVLTNYSNSVFLSETEKIYDHLLK